MKTKGKYINWGSFALLFFVILGYTVKFYPQTLSSLDRTFQTWLQKGITADWTIFYKVMTILGNVPVFFGGVMALAAYFYLVKKWRAESYFLVLNSGLLLGLSTVFKSVYNRPRPTLMPLIETPIGASFPSWHGASMLLLALCLAIIAYQRLGKRTSTMVLQGSLILVAVAVALSRIFLGVSYLSDILASWCLASAIVCISFPFYDQKRFEWRFKSLQK